MICLPPNAIARDSVSNIQGLQIGSSGWRPAESMRLEFEIENPSIEKASIRAFQLGGSGV